MGKGGPRRDLCSLIGSSACLPFTQISFFPLPPLIPVSTFPPGLPHRTFSSPASPYLPIALLFRAKTSSFSLRPSSLFRAYQLELSSLTPGLLPRTQPVRCCRPPRRNPQSPPLCYTSCEAFRTLCRLPWMRERSWASQLSGKSLLESVCVWGGGEAHGRALPP